MSASPLNKLIDINRVAEVGFVNVEMMQTMHDALFEIARSEPGLIGSLEQKRIAEAALVEVYAKANKLEKNKCLN